MQKGKQQIILIFVWCFGRLSFPRLVINGLLGLCLWGLCKSVELVSGVLAQSNWYQSAKAGPCEIGEAIAACHASGDTSPATNNSSRRAAARESNQSEEKTSLGWDFAKMNSHNEQNCVERVFPWKRQSRNLLMPHERWSAMSRAPRCSFGLCILSNFARSDAELRVHTFVTLCDASFIPLNPYSHAAAFPGDSDVIYICVELLLLSCQFNASCMFELFLESWRLFNMCNMLAKIFLQRHKTILSFCLIKDLMQLSSYPFIVAI